jgi:hypothetical protein
MKFVKIAGLCLASMLASMALAGTVSAATPLWLLCLPWTNSPTKYTTNQCKTAGEGSPSSWESVSIGTKSDTVRILLLSLRLEDEKGELGAAVRVKCNHVKGFGLISNRNLLLIFKAEVEVPKEECEGEGTGLFKVCKKEGLEEVRGTNLPWRVEVYEETEGKYISNILANGGGEPGWKVKCAGVEDTCTSEAGKPVKVSGVNALTEEGTTSTLLVFAQFLKNRGSCTVGGKEAGSVVGWLAILLYNGNGLSLNLF